ncbi:HlyU family transcriptional regulator [Consotaella aegiceratis]|uniref:HlyU family transcriptional regulator n=1 Tax=Consotaella aegiceratis TaxID=3097961 RepID=UPI002F3EB6F5
MSFLKKLFGGGGETSSAPRATATEDYNGFSIAAQPMREGGQFRLAAMIQKEIGGETKSHRLIRADLFQSEDEATGAALRKARQVIDEQGDKLFD